MNRSVSTNAALQARLAPLQARWVALSARERQLVLVMGIALAVLLVWLIAVQPAWRTWREVPAQAAELELQWLQMQALASEAGQLKGQAPVSTADASAALKASVTRLGNHGTLALLGDRATLTLKAMPPEEFRSWLAEARLAARARPVQMKLSRADDGLSGTLVLQLPGSP
ncbi:type II secretion system protein M [Ideonella azotifigens]|uniref:Type II secretion system protein M n=1 Tax=Ideonella azotifigens TaxID=513160 RepID=A0ABN1KJ60_9BURK|nr:type II secretion system protein GspM [Ideonella azotifigens]MCD2339440.1 type II secretion system protein M [Ideonella azotifigens]